MINGYISYLRLRLDAERMGDFEARPGWIIYCLAEMTAYSGRCLRLDVDESGEKVA